MASRSPPTSLGFPGPVPLALCEGCAERQDVEEEASEARIVQHPEEPFVFRLFNTLLCKSVAALLQPPCPCYCSNASAPLTWVACFPS